VLLKAGGRSVDSTRRSEILIENRDFAYSTCIRRPRRFTATKFSMEKLEWHGYPTVKKVWFIRFDRIYERDRQIDGRTDTATV